MHTRPPAAMKQAHHCAYASSMLKMKVSFQRLVHELLCPFKASVAQFSRPNCGLKSHCPQDDAQETQQDITIQPTWNAEAEEVHDLLSKAGLYWCVRDTCPHQHNDQINTWYNTTCTARSTTQHHAAPRSTHAAPMQHTSSLITTHHHGSL